MFFCKFTSCTYIFFHKITSSNHILCIFVYFLLIFTQFCV
nr:MAG TPA: hypothetical protein [Bacteriophage sp.]